MGICFSIRLLGRFIKWINLGALGIYKIKDQGQNSLCIVSQIQIFGEMYNEMDERNVRRLNLANEITQYRSSSIIRDHTSYMTCTKCRRFSDPFPLCPMSAYFLSFFPHFYSTAIHILAYPLSVWTSCKVLLKHL